MKTTQELKEKALRDLIGLCHGNVIIALEEFAAHLERGTCDRAIVSEIKKCAKQFSSWH